MMMKCEWKKIFLKPINRIVLIIAFLLSIVFSCFAIGSARYTDEEGVSHNGAVTAARSLAADKNRWKGNLTPEKIAEAANDKKELVQRYPEGIPDTEWGKSVQSYSDITWFVLSVLIPDLSVYDESVLYQDEQIKNIYTTYESNMQKMVEEYGETPEQKAFLAKQYEKVSMPLQYKAKESWDIMTMYATTYGIILAVIIGFLATGIFAEEFQTGAEAVFFSAKYGRTRATKNKIAVGMLMATVVYWIGMGILSLISFGIMGASGFFTPYQINQPYSIYPMTFGQYYLIILVSGYIASLLAASVSMLVAAKMHNASVAVCVPFFMYCMLPFIGRALSSLTKVFRLTPDNLVNIIGCAKAPNLFQIGGTVFSQIPFVMLLYLVAAVVLLPFVYKSVEEYI